LFLNPLSNRWIRVTALAAALLAVSSVVTYRSARARTGEALSLLGEQAMRIPLGRYGNEVQRIDINGFEMMLQTARSDAPFEEVVRQFEEACLAKGGMDKAEFGQAELAHARQQAKSRSQDSRSARTAFDGVFVKETPRGTVIACIDTQGVPWISHEMLNRLQRFSKNGDLATLGVFRYALVKRTDHGAHFVTGWSGASAPLLTMFPKTGDAPGADHRMVPRIAGSRRVLSTRAHGLQLVGYEHPDQALNDVITTTENALKATAGLTYKDLGGAPPGARFWVGRGDSQAFVMFAERDGRVFTTVTDTPE
jgi:hypothetical protein